MNKILAFFGFKKSCDDNPKSLHQLMTECPPKMRERYYLEAARKASEDQQKMIQRGTNGMAINH